MKTFQSEIYNKKRKQYECVLVEWEYSAINGQCTLKGITGRDGDVQDVCEKSHIQSIKAQMERLALNLTYKERERMTVNILK